MTPDERIILSVLSIAWEPKNVQWVSNGCSLGTRDCKRILDDLTRSGSVSRLKQRGIDENGLDYTYHAYILSDRASPWMTR